MNSLKEQLNKGNQVYGTWSVLPSPGVAEIMGSAGLDYFIIDMEHGPADYETAENMIRAVDRFNCTPLIRVPENEPWMILRALETGAGGVVVPGISSEKDAEKAVKAMKYHPRGNRGMSPFTRSWGYRAHGTEAFTDKCNKETLTVLIVEGTDGIARLDKILQVEDIDVIYIGTYDLSQSVGHPGNPSHPEVLAFVKQCTELIKSKGVAAGCLAENSEDLANWKKAGIQFVAYQADCSLFFSQCRSVLEEAGR